MSHSPNILVCVTKQKTCERLIKKAAAMLESGNGELFVIHVVRTGDNFLENEHEGEALDYLFNISKKSGASMNVIRSNDVLGALSSFVEKNKINCVVLGESPSSNENQSAFSIRLQSRIKGVEIKVIPPED